jgi:hypothetical protein
MRVWTTSERQTKADNLPLILPMPRCSYRKPISSAPWITIDPVLRADCVALCRNGRLMLLALVAFVVGSVRARAEDLGEAVDAVVVALTDHPSKPALREFDQANTESRERRFPLQCAPEDAPQKGNAHFASETLSPRLKLLLQSMRSHAPPAFCTYFANRSFGFKPTDRLFSSIPSNAKRQRPTIRTLLTAALFHALNLSNENRSSGAMMAALSVPPRQLAEYSIERTHAPPTGALATCIAFPRTGSLVLSSSSRCSSGSKLPQNPAHTCIEVRAHDADRVADLRAPDVRLLAFPHRSLPSLPIDSSPPRWEDEPIFMPP